MKRRKGHLTYGTYNINGLRQKTDILNALISELQLDVLALNETKLNTLASFPPGRYYEAINSGAKRGIAFSINQSITYRRIFDGESAKHQCIGIRISDLTLVALYMVPESNRRD